MKRSNIILILGLFMVMSLMAQGKCSKFYPIKKNAYFTHTIYDKEPSTPGAVEQGKVTYKVTEVGDNWANYTVKVEAMGFSRPEMKQKITCTDNGVIIKNMQPGSTQGSKTTGNTNFYLPNDLSVAASLNDVEMKLSGPGGRGVSRILTNRKVLGANETITTPAGRFSCYKVSHTTKIGTFKTNDTQWLGEDVGIVKTIERDTSGNILSVTLLTSYKLPNNEVPAARF